MNQNNTILDNTQIIKAGEMGDAMTWIKALADAGAQITENDSVNDVQNITAQKIAIIIGESTPDEGIDEIIEKYEEMLKDNETLSVRYFVLRGNNSTDPKNTHNRIRVIRYMDLAPNATPERISRPLYKARLPLFLRTGYDIDITEEILPDIPGRYRKVVLKSYEGTGEHKELKYTTQNTYIHNKELYEIRQAETSDILSDTFLWHHLGNNIFARKIGEDGQILGEIQGSDRFPPGLLHIFTFKNEETDE